MQAHRAILISSFLLFLCPFIACNFEKKDQLNEEESEQKIHVLASLLILKPEEGKTYFKNKLFTGFGIKAYNKTQFSEKISYLKGAKEGLVQKWFQDGTLSYEANYQAGKLNGQSRSWWKNGNIRSESNFVNGLGQGLQLQWYKSGNLFKRIQLNNGVEEGIQQSWRENGKIYNNYEAKNGRIFGLKRSNLCYELENENIKLKDN